MRSQFSGSRRGLLGRFALAAIICFVVFTLLPINSVAQRTTGTLRGQVLDPQGALVAKANVTVTNQATGVTVTTETTSAGTWEVPSLIPGSYTVTVDAPGFRKYVRRDVPVLANQDNEANAQLQLGATTEVVEVTAQAVAVTTTTSTLTNNYVSSDVIGLPSAGGTLNGSPLNLAILAPNVVAQPGGVTGIGGSIGGTRPRDNNFVVDGVDDNNLGVTGPNSTVIPDAVAEFNLQTNQFSAEYGHSAGGQFQLVTKSGTNNWHGSGYEYFQNRNLNAMDNLTKKAIADKTIPGQPNYNNNRFGGNIGGPLIKGKWFIFGDYEYTTLHGEGSATFLEAPTAAGLASMSALAADSTVKTILTKYPIAPSQASTCSATGTGSGSLPCFVVVNGTNIPFGNLVEISPVFQREHDAVVNSDYTTGKHQLAVRFLFNQEKFIFPVNSTQQDWNQDEPVHNRKIALSDSWTLNNRMVNDLRVQYSFYLLSLSNPCTGVPGTNALKPGDCFPDITLEDLGSTTVGPSDVQSQKQNTYAVKDTFAWVRGKHTVKFGGDYDHFIYPQFFLPRSIGDNWFTSTEAFVNDNPGGLDTGRTLRGAGSGGFLGTQSLFGAFVQDDIRVTPRLTLNLGLRYEYWTNPVGAATQALNAISSVPGLITFGVPKTDTNNFGPRFGFAWDPKGNGKWSIRGGAGIAYDVKFQNFASITLPPQLQSEMNVDSACGLSAPPSWCATGTGFLQGGGLPPTYLPPTSIAAARKLTTSFIDDTVMPKITTWTLGVQHEVYQGATLEVRYLGTKGQELPVQFRRNRQSFFDFCQALAAPDASCAPLATYLSAAAIPATVDVTENGSGVLSLTPSDFKVFNTSTRKPAYATAKLTSNITADPPIGASIYHALSFNFVQRNRHGLTMNANYTFSHTIDNSTNEFFTSFLNPRRAQDTNQIGQDRSNSDLDVRHKLAFSLIYQFPNSHAESGLMKALFNGWGLGSVYLMQSGQPITLQSGNAGVDSNHNGDTAGDRVVLNSKGTKRVGSDVFAVCAVTPGSSSPLPVGSTYIASIPYTSSGVISGDSTQTFNGCASNTNDPVGAAANFGVIPSDPAIGYTPVDPTARYVLAGTGALTTVGRNSFVSPGFGIWNASAFKNIRISEGKSLQFKADAYNVLNTRNYTLSNTNVFSTTGVTTATTNPGYGIVTDPGFLNPSVFSSGNRTMTLAVHLFF